MGNSIRHLLSSLKKVDQEHSLIRSGDRICCPILSRYADLALLEALSKYRFLSKKSYELVVILIDDGYEADLSSISGYLKQSGVESKEYDASFIKPSLETYERQGRKNLSSIYRRLVRNAMIDVAKENHCNKIAVSSSYSEALESLFLHLFYQRSVSTFLPNSELKGMGISIIRPFYYVEDDRLESFAKEKGYPFKESRPFPKDNSVVKEMLISLPLEAKKNLSRLLKEEGEASLPSLYKDYEIVGTPYSVRRLHVEEEIYPLFKGDIVHKESQEGYALIKKNKANAWLFLSRRLNHYLEISYLKGKEEDKLLLLNKVIALKSEEIHPLNVILLNQNASFSLKAGFQKKYEIAYKKEKWCLRIN